MPLQDDMLRQMSATQQQVDNIIVPELADDLISPFLALPGLRGFWPMSAVDFTNPQALDLAGADYHLTNNNISLFNYDGLVPYVDFNGTTQYLSRADGGAAQWADITGTETYIDSTVRGLTIGGWFWFDDAPGAFETLSGKRTVAVGNYSYYLQRINTGLARFVVSVDGTATTVVNSTGITMTTGVWWCVIGRFDPSTTLSVFVNNQETQNVAAIPASVFDSNSLFTICSSNGAANLYDGRASLCFLCASYLSDAIISSLFQQTRAAFGV